MKQFVLAAAATIGLAGLATAQPTSANFESTPFFTDTFAGGTATGLWELDPDLTGAVTPSVLNAPTFTTTTPSGIDPDIVSADPVASTDGVMVVGNDSADFGTHFGLIYAIATNSQADGNGDDLTLLENYKLEARLWLVGTSEYSGTNDRFQVGPYFHAGSAAGGAGGDLFRGSVWYNVGTTGGGPGVLWRGLDDATANLGTNTAALSSGAWRWFSILVLNDTIAVGYDANGDGTIDEGDPNEFNNTLTRDTTDAAVGTFGIFGVGDVSSDVHPLFVDEVRVYDTFELAGAEAWEMYDY